MGCEELIASLQRTGEEKAGTLWEAAGTEAERLREEAAQKIRQMKAELSAALASEIRKKTGRIIVDAENRARTVRFSAEAELSSRLYEVAQSCLGELRKEGYESIFGKIVAELPPPRWQFVRVNPEDILTARDHFPDAEVIPDNEITGGVDVTAGKGRMRVINTFEKRLERAWQDMLPAIIADVLKEISADGTSHQS